MNTKRKSSKKKGGNLFTNNKLITSLIIGAGAGTLVAWLYRSGNLDEITDTIVDKSKKFMDEYSPIVKAKLEEYSPISKAVKESFEYGNNPKVG